MNWIKLADALVNESIRLNEESSIEPEKRLEFQIKMTASVIMLALSKAITKAQIV